MLRARGYPRLAKGARLKIVFSGRDLVAQAFVGSSPTPRTFLEPTNANVAIAGYSEYLELKGNSAATISSKT